MITRRLELDSRAHDDGFAAAKGKKKKRTQGDAAEETLAIEVKTFLLSSTQHSRYLKLVARHDLRGAFVLCFFLAR